MYNAEKTLFVQLNNYFVHFSTQKHNSIAVEDFSINEIFR